MTATAAERERGRESSKARDIKIYTERDRGTQGERQRRIPKREKAGETKTDVG